MKWCGGGVAPPNQDVGCARNGTVCVLMLSRLCCVSGLLVGFGWSVKRMEEQDGVVLGVSWALLSRLASGHWSTSNEHFWLWLLHTLAADMIKWTRLVILYLMHVFYVV